MNQLHEHCRLLLGLDFNWTVGDVELSLEGKRLEIRLEFTGAEVGPFSMPISRVDCA